MILKGMRVDKGMVLAGLLLIGCGFVPPRPSTRSQAGGISGVSHPQLRGGGGAEAYYG